MKTVSAREIMEMCRRIEVVESQLKDVLNLAIKLGKSIDKDVVVREIHSEVVYHVSAQNILKGLQYEVDNLASNYYARLNGIRKRGANIGVTKDLTNNQLMSDLQSYTSIRLPEFKPYELGGNE